MSLLQRPPIDVHASIGCKLGPTHLYETTQRLLAAGTGARPYAGGIVRRALHKPQLAEWEERQRDADDIPFIEPALEPVNRAIREWWPTQPLASELTPSPLRRADVNDSCLIRWHHDQYSDGEGLPIYGPITAVMVLSGSVKYGLSVLRRPLGNTAQELSTAERWNARHADSLIAHAGDIVLMTTMPPTYHMAEAQEPAIRVVCDSVLMPNTVE